MQHHRDTDTGEFADRVVINVDFDAAIVYVTAPSAVTRDAEP